MSVGSFAEVGGQDPAPSPEAAPANPRREVMASLVRQKAFWAGVLILLFWVFCAIFGPAVVPHPPNAGDLNAVYQAPSGSHLFGTDQLGRDMFSRVIVGARPIMIVAPLATLLGTFLGTSLGLIMGYFGGYVDEITSRFVEAFLAIPLIIVGILGVVAVGASDVALIILIGIVFTPLIARTVRAAVQGEVELEYVTAARLRGESSLYIMFVEILPNITGPIIVEFTVRLGYAIFTLVTLSFLGFGIQPPTANWGADISNNIGGADAGYWWAVLFPALAIASLVIAVNLVANSIDAAVEDL